MAHAFGVDDDAHISSAILEFTSHGWSRSVEHTFQKVDHYWKAPKS
jgi:hypothetical protein